MSKTVAPTVGVASVEAATPKSAAFTPGPWVALGDRVISDGSFDTICAVTKEVNRAWTIEAPEIERANARLIAAAPCLLEALQALADITAEAWLSLASQAPLRNARAAIAKATGHE